MLKEVSKAEYNSFFKDNRNPFLNNNFLEVNEFKADEIIRLVNEVEKPTIGLIAGRIGKKILNHFSAPFGGIHYKNEAAYVSELESFIISLKEYLIENNYQFFITFPPSIYGKSFNSKMINVMIRNGFNLQIPELTNWVDLRIFNYQYTFKTSREYFRQAERKNLMFLKLETVEEKRQAFDIVKDNRIRQNRPIYMNFDDVVKTGEVFLTDIFGVFSEDKTMVASAICYRFNNDIGFAVLWGDSEEGRQLRAMDFLSYNLFSFYKSLNFSYFDLGKSTEDGSPNEGLLRFKETHECVTELRHTVSYGI